jgi:peptidoglycan hydrolase-like protein with peptidoglycan-binding domain
MSMGRLAGLLLCAAALLLAGPVGFATAETYPVEIRFTHNVFGEKVFKGEIATENGRFETFMISGNSRVHLTGSVSGDTVSVYGELQISGTWRFKPFSADGAFSDSTFSQPIVAHSVNGQSARGSISVTRPTAVVAVPPPAEQVPEVVAPTIQPQPQAAVVTPPEPREPPLSRNQRMAIQRQLGLLGFYRSGIDGDFGPGTRKAIAAFQRAGKLEPSGYLTDETMGLLAERATAREQQLAAEQLAADEERARQAEAAQTTEQAEAAPQDAPAVAAPEPPAIAAAPPAAEPPAAPATPADDFGAVIATLEPIDAEFVVVRPARVRAQPTVTADAIETLAVGDRIDVLGRLPREDWYLVARQGRPLGYVVASQLAAPTTLADTRTLPAAEVPATPQAPTIPPELAALDFGRYHAIVIGNNDYRKLPRLKTAVADAKAVAAMLEQDYGFTVSLLLDATEEAVIGEMNRMRRTLTPQDNLLIYYAGHGWYDEEADRGYWLPVDAAADNQSSWISNADITDMLKAMKAKHVLVVADSCFSGTLTRGLAIVTQSAGHIESMVKRRARTALTSGGTEPVLDAGGGAHSVFAKAFLETLQGNAGILDGQSAFQQVSEQVRLNAEQEPTYDNIRLAGHDGGDFLFVRKR